MIARLCVITVSLVATAAFLSSARHPELIPPREPFADFPLQIGNWKATAELGEVYRAARELGIESNLAELEAFGFTIVPPESVTSRWRASSADMCRLQNTTPLPTRCCTGMFQRQPAVCA